MTAERDRYAFPNTAAVQRERLRTLEALLDDGTVRQLEARGVQPGWRCLEVGAGGGSIAAWLCERVGSEGSVLATDLDVSVLRELARPNLEIRVHDVLEDDLPEAEFDLIHFRLLLAWLPTPAEALERLLAALKPGAWLVAEEMDFVSVVPGPGLEEHERRAWTRAMEAHNTVLSSRFDPFYGRRLLADVMEAGLVDTGGEGRSSMWRGGEAGGAVYRLTFSQLYEPMVATRLVTAAEMETVMRLCEESRFTFLSQITMTAWGRRPA